MLSVIDNKDDKSKFAIDIEDNMMIAGVKFASSLIQREDIVHGTTERIQTPVGKLYVTVNKNSNGMPVEVIINAGKAGKEVQAWAEFAGRLISTALKYGAPLESLVKQGRHIAGSKPFFYKADVDARGILLKSGPDAVSYAMARYVNDESVNVEPAQEEGDIVEEVCEACGGANVVRDAGCLSCRDCGYSGCS